MESGEPTPMRDRIIEAAIDELARNGSEFFRGAHICEQLFISRSLVNHHFGSQAGLITEAAVTAYERYILRLAAAARVPSSARDRLEAWMTAQGLWFRENRGIAALLQLPAPPYARLFAERHAERLQRGFRFNMAVLAHLVRDVQTGTPRPLDFTLDTAPYRELLSDDIALLMRSASVGMSALGASVWLAGQAMPSRDLPERFLQGATMTQHVRWVTRSISALGET